MSLAAVTIRRERPDHPAVVALLDQLDAYLASLYAPEDNHILDVQALLASDVHFLIAEDDDGRILGCAATRRVPADPDRGEPAFGEIKRMVVAEPARGQRIGERLLQGLERHLHGGGIGLARLETGRDQHAALRLYERCGYRPRAAFGGYPDNGLSVFLEKRLTP